MKHHYLEKKIYSNLNLGDITGADYMHAKRVLNDFGIKNWSEYLHVQSGTLLLADAFKNLRINVINGIERC